MTLRSLLPRRAKQRFESESVPWRRFACTLNATCLALSSEVDDAKRTAEERSAAKQTLKHMTPQNLILMGLASDLQAHWVAFRRKLDTCKSDPALVARTVAEMKVGVVRVFSSTEDDVAEEDGSEKSSDESCSTAGL